MPGIAVLPTEYVVNHKDNFSPFRNGRQPDLLGVKFRYYHEVHDEPTGPEWKRGDRSPVSVWRATFVSMSSGLKPGVRFSYEGRNWTICQMWSNRPNDAHLPNRSGQYCVIVVMADVKDDDPPYLQPGETRRYLVATEPSKPKVCTHGCDSPVWCEVCNAD